MNIRIFACAVSMAWILLTMPAAAHKRQVGLMLILALDVSSSMNDERRENQRRGYVRAFRDADIVGAIESGGSVAVSVVQWGDITFQVTGPWHLIEGRVSADVFAGYLESMTLHRANSTSIIGALRACRAAFARAPFASDRKVVDISGDGEDNDGGPSTMVAELLAKARRDLLALDVTINALPLYPYPGSDGRNRELVDYYRRRVIGGPNAFLIEVENPSDEYKFAEGIKRKLWQEIASR